MMSSAFEQEDAGVLLFLGWGGLAAVHEKACADRNVEWATWRGGVDVTLNHLSQSSLAHSREAKEAARGAGDAVVSG